jgi:hypothetical protein
LEFLDFPAIDRREGRAGIAFDMRFLASEEVEGI